jgi:hypothetical protein
MHIDRLAYPACSFEFLLMDVQGARRPRQRSENNVALRAANTSCARNPRIFHVSFKHEICRYGAGSCSNQ